MNREGEVAENFSCRREEGEHSHHQHHHCDAAADSWNKLLSNSNSNTSSNSGSCDSSSSSCVSSSSSSCDSSSSSRSGGYDASLFSDVRLFLHKVGVRIVTAGEGKTNLRLLTVSYEQVSN